MIVKKESKLSEPKLSASPSSAGATGCWVLLASGHASLAQRHHHLVQPEQGVLGGALPAVDAAQPQEVEDDGQRHDQDAGKEEIVVVDKREAQPGAVCLPDALLTEIPMERNVRTGHEMQWGTARVLPQSVQSPYPAQLLLLLPSHPSPCDASTELMVPEWQKSRLVEDGPQCPLHLPVIHQLGCAQAGVVQRELETLMKDLVHPG